MDTHHAHKFSSGTPAQRSLFHERSSYPVRRPAELERTAPEAEPGLRISGKVEPGLPMGNERAGDHRVEILLHPGRLDANNRRTGTAEEVQKKGIECKAEVGQMYTESVLG